jgi:Restriction endonuclease
MASLAISTNAGKYASEYPLPGGVEQYFDTLVALLRYIRDNALTSGDLSKWMFDTFPNASGQIAVNGYIAVLTRLELWSQQENLIRLTPVGTSVVNKAESAPDEARFTVIEIKYRDFLGYDVLFKLLSQGQRSLDEIHEHLKEALAVDWKSKNQTTFRVNWLRSLRYVEKDSKEYRLTQSGSDAYKILDVTSGATVTAPMPAPTIDAAIAPSPLAKRASEIADWLDKMAVAGGDGKEFEQATEAAFKFLGFETQLISGSGNPDVLATAAMGEKTFRLLIDSKSRASGVVQQNDVNFHVLEKQRQNSGADHVVVVGADFSAGNLEEFAATHNVRLLSTSEIRELLMAHAEMVFPLDLLRSLFQGGGSTDEGVFSEILTSAESKSEVMILARKVFAAVKEFQDKEGEIQISSLFYILKCEHSLSTIKLAVGFLKSDLIGALGETERGSLFTRVSPTTLTNKLSQITRTMDLSEPSGA